MKRSLMPHADRSMVVEIGQTMGNLGEQLIGTMIQSVLEDWYGEMAPQQTNQE